MIYVLGSQLQTLDLADRAATQRLLGDIRIDFTSMLGENCLLCLLHAHAGSEEWAAFPSVSNVKPGLIADLIAEHHDLTQQLTSVSERSTALLRLEDPDTRIEVGAELNRRVNDFFATYLLHMNREETALVPALQRHFTNERILAVGTAVQRHSPRERWVTYLERMLPALNAPELTALFSGAKRGAPSETVRLLTRIAAALVEPSRWKIVPRRLQN